MGKQDVSSSAEKQCPDPATHIPARDHSNSPRPLQSVVEPGSLDPPGDSQPAASSGQSPPDDFEYMAKIRTLAETERFFDELSKEKDQVKESHLQNWVLHAGASGNGASGMPVPRS